MHKLTISPDDRYTWLGIMRGGEERAVGRSIEGVLLYMRSNFAGRLYLQEVREQCLGERFQVSVEITLASFLTLTYHH